MRSTRRAFVESWIRRRRAAGGAPLAHEALSVVWRRARRSVSELSLMALARAARDAAARDFELLADLHVGPGGFDLGAAAEADDDALLAALGGLLIELLNLFDETSGEILAPALQAELLRVGAPRRARPLAQKAAQSAG